MCRILIVDDNKPNRELVRLILKKTSCEIIEAVDGQEGIDKARQSRPDIIMMDIQMPIMDGVRAMKLIKSDPALSNVPVIAITSYAMAGDREKMLDAGFDDYFSKPFKVEEVLSIVEKYLSKPEA